MLQTTTEPKNTSVRLRAIALRSDFNPSCFARIFVIQKAECLSFLDAFIRSPTISYRNGGRKWIPVWVSRSAVPCFPCLVVFLDCLVGDLLLLLLLLVVLFFCCNETTGLGTFFFSPTQDPTNAASNRITSNRVAEHGAMRTISIYCRGPNESTLSFVLGARQDVIFTQQCAALHETSRHVTR